MAKFSRIEVSLKMKETGLVPVFYSPDTEVCKAVIKACYDGGIRVFEFTNRGDFAHEVFAVLSRWTAAELPDLILGTGSVVDAATAALYIQLGSNFIVSPLLNEEMARTCNRRKILWAPGCGSLSEISRAEELGAEIVKMFPGDSVGGPSFVKNIKGPCPWTSIMPTGGVSPEESNLKAWFDAGVHCVGMGSKLITSELLSRKDFAGLTEKVRLTLSVIAAVRQ